MTIKKTLRMLLLFIVVIGLFIGTAVITARNTRRAVITAEEQTTEEPQEIQTETAPDTRLDKYSMQEYCQENSNAVFDALRSHDSKALDDIMISSEGTENVMEFADWGTADFDEAISMGSGSLTAEPDENGRMDESERFFVYAGNSRYVFFIETQTSDYGRTNDGVSAVAVTTFSHFDATDYAWNGEADDQSAIAGELFWKN